MCCEVSSWTGLCRLGLSNSRAWKKYFLALGLQWGQCLSSKFTPFPYSHMIMWTEARICYLVKCAVLNTVGLSIIVSLFWLPAQISNSVSKQVSEWQEKEYNCKHSVVLTSTITFSQSLEREHICFNILPALFIFKFISFSEKKMDNPFTVCVCVSARVCVCVCVCKCLVGIKLIIFLFVLFFLGGWVGLSLYYM